MSERLITMAPYLPLTLMASVLRNPTVTADPVAERFPAAVLFADVSGFTPLTESLAQHGTEGPEELTRLLNYSFGRIMTIIEAEGGDVMKFSGDAVTVLFPATNESLNHAIRRAKQAADTMQTVMTEFATLPTSVGPIALRMKIGIGAGEVLTMQVGGVLNRWEYVIAGDPLRQVAVAEKQAKRNEVILSPEAHALLHPDPLPPRALEQPKWSAVSDAEVVASSLQRFIPGAVWGWLTGKLSQWVAVLRPMSVLFIGVYGLDYSHSETPQRLHTFLKAVQQTTYRWEGSLNKLAVDDKGTILLILFGAPPVFHEDDPVRAVRCALDLQQVAEAQGLTLAVGITTGHVFAGPVGSKTRREYTVMGDSVNLAARLMGLAEPGQIRCEHVTYRRAQHHWGFETLAPVQVKGKSELIRVYRPTGQRIDQQLVIEKSQRVLIGRQTERARLEKALDTIAAGHSRVLIIEGEAGIGKSRLVAELTALAQARDVKYLLGTGQSIERQTPYRAWRNILITYFGLEESTDYASGSGQRLAEQQERVQHIVATILPEQLPRLPLLNDVLSLAFPDTELTAALDPQLHQQSLKLLLVEMLRVLTRERSLVLVLEDAQWLDSLSWELAVYVARAIQVSDDPLLFVIVSRPLDERSTGITYLGTLQAMEIMEPLALTRLNPGETTMLATACLGLPPGDLPVPVADLVQQRAEGNPFFAQEVIFALRDQGFIELEIRGDRLKCLIKGDLTQARHTLPDTVQSLILVRIDRLPPEQQLALRVAAVIGHTFAYIPLAYTLNHYAAVVEHTLKTQLNDLIQHNFIAVEHTEPDVTYIFKNVITQEAAYQSLLFAQRRELHRIVAEWYETTFGREHEKDLEVRSEVAAPSSLTPYYPLLAHHYHQAEDQDKERYYVRLAGEQAAKQFANHEAVTYLSRALSLTPDENLTDRYDLLLARESLYDLLGERELQRQDLVTLQKLADELGHASQVEVALRWANYSEAISDYRQTIISAHKAVTLAQTEQMMGLAARGYLEWGRAFYCQGNYAVARTHLDRAIELAQAEELSQLELPEVRAKLTQCSLSQTVKADSLRLLGLVVDTQGDYASAMDYLEQALHICRETGNRRGESDTLNNLGLVAWSQDNYVGARKYWEQTLSISQEVGDRQGEGMAFTNLGEVCRSQGDYTGTRRYYEQALYIFREIGDRRGEGYVLSNLSLVLHNLGDDQASRETSQQALRIAQDTGNRSLQGVALTNLGHALTGLGHLPEATEAYQRALDIRFELGVPHLVMESLAGLCQISLIQGNIPQALTQIAEILTYLETGSLYGTDEPFRVYLICYQVLQAAHDPRARKILETAYHLLQEQAARIPDEEPRRAFLEKIPYHRELITAWETA